MIRTNVKRVVVAAESVDKGLLWGCLIADDPVGLAILRDRLALGRARNGLGEPLAGDLSADVETCRLQCQKKSNGAALLLAPNSRRASHKVCPSDRRACTLIR
jgi:hypothetical protein